MNKLGFMQGRLTNKGGFFPQQFPEDQWEKEFEIAAQIGFDCVEWMFNYDNWENNPLMHSFGLDKICIMQEKTGILVSGICANYFMKKSIYDVNDKIENIIILSRLIDSAQKIGCNNIVLPLFEESAARLEDETFHEILMSVQDESINILLETDCEMDTVYQWLKANKDLNVGVCYDIGNAVGLGRNTIQEMNQYADIVKNVHVKDKGCQGTTVMLGQGDAEIKATMDALCKNNYQDCFILESYYGQNAIEDTQCNYCYVKDLLKK